MKHDDAVRYQRRGILRTERLYGTGYQSPGGKAATKQLAERLDSARRTGARVLDIGCGTGGAAMLLAKEHRAKVTGVDVAPVPIELCQERARAHELADIRFLQADASRPDLFPAQSFDCAWTRDSVLYIEDKRSLWANVFAWLVPGGQLLATDFGLGHGARSDEFSDYVAESHFHLQSLEDYCATLTGVGFEEVEAQNITSEFIKLNQRELGALRSQQASFLDEFSAQELSYLEQRWEKKIRLAERGELAWFRFFARRPK